jgi:hypothetical protein
MKIVKTVLAALFAVSISNCASTDSATWDPAFNPLDAPGEQNPPVAEFHKKNVARITARPYHGPLD